MSPLPGNEDERSAIEAVRKLLKHRLASTTTANAAANANASDNASAYSNANANAYPNANANANAHPNANAAVPLTSSQMGVEFDEQNAVRKAAREEFLSIVDGKQRH